MPFIWDDNKYYFLDEEDSYSKDLFVIARKLFVTPAKDDPELLVSDFDILFHVQI